MGYFEEYERRVGANDAGNWGHIRSRRHTRNQLHLNQRSLHQMGGLALSRYQLNGRDERVFSGTDRCTDLRVDRWRIGFLVAQEGFKVAHYLGAENATGFR